MWWTIILLELVCLSLLLWKKRKAIRIALTPDSPLVKRLREIDWDSQPVSYRREWEEEGRKHTEEERFLPPEEAERLLGDLLPKAGHLEVTTKEWEEK